MRTAASCLVACLALPACLAEDRGAVVEPVFADGKADVADRVDDLGALGLYGARVDRFDEDLEFHGYRLSVAAGARVEIDNSHKGTARDLDSTLFLYGPRTASGFGTAAIAFDDDSGWGYHARLSPVVLDQAGEYLVVLGTRDGMDRGHYRLLARCLGENCSPCPDLLYAEIAACVDDVIADVDPEEGPTSPEDAIGICTDGEALGGARDAMCAADPGHASCALSFEDFYLTMAKACAADLAATHL